MLVSEFATATRNFAKRQISWYRKDPLFLFLRISRQQWERPVVQKKNTKKLPSHAPRSRSASREVDLAPYEKVSAELLHWASLPRAQYDQFVGEQKSNAAVYCDLMSRKHLPLSYRVESDLARRVLCRMVAGGLLRMPDNQWTSDTGSTDSWVASIRDPSQGVTPNDIALEPPAEWSAQGL